MLAHILIFIGLNTFGPPPVIVQHFQDYQECAAVRQDLLVDLAERGIPRGQFILTCVPEKTT